MLFPVLGRILVYWKPVMAGAVALALFIPVPGYAFTWLSDWSVFQNQTGGAPAAVVSSSQFDSGGTLTIDMGQYQAHAPYSSHVTTYAAFTVDNPTETLSLVDSFQSLQKNSTEKLKVGVVSLDNYSHYVLDTNTSKVNGFHSNYFDYSNSASQTLQAGTYILVVTVKYDTNRFKLRSSTIDVSPFSFTFTSI
jgi:hypothetical protein